jgi:hypothetical protein
MEIAPRTPPVADSTPDVSPPWVQQPEVSEHERGSAEHEDGPPEEPGYGHGV